MKNITIERNSYGAIEIGFLPQRTKKQIRNLVKLAATAQKVDEHGNWEFGATFDRRGRGAALNWDLYGYGRDYHNRRLLIVIQIRQWEKTRRNGYPNVKKSYFLVGRNEDNSAFAHPVESRVVHHAIRNNLDVVRRVQSWIFGADYTRVLRHGDVALVPIRRPTNTKTLKTKTLVLQPSGGSASHTLAATEIKQRTNGILYAKNPSLVHGPGTHPDVIAKGWHKVMIGNRATFHEFAAPTID
jgi:hypothetical protein